MEHILNLEQVKKYYGGNSGYDCGMSIAGYNDIKVGDIIEGFEEVEVNRSL